MTAYDVFGKRFRIPPLTDVAQGVAWFCWIGFGATLVSGGFPPLAVEVGAYAVLYTTLINGVHGGMRDLRNDLACDAWTTARFLGIRPRGESGIAVSAAAIAYCVLHQAALVALSMGVTLRAGGGTAALLVVAAANAACVFGLVRVLQPERPGWGLAFRLHLFLLLIPIIAAVAPVAGADNAAVAALVLALPLLLLDATARMLGWFAGEGARA